MSLVSWSPFEGMERFLGQFGELPHSRVGFDLAVDVYEENNQVIAEMNISGIDPKKLDVEIDARILKISGIREFKKEQKQTDFYRREIRYGSFERVVTLPKKVASEGTEANYKDGILCVSMPIEMGSKRKKIAVS